MAFTLFNLVTSDILYWLTIAVKISGSLSPPISAGTVSTTNTYPGERTGTFDLASKASSMIAVETGKETFALIS
ncbi:hypothetical protein HYFRA_00001338 [Hymenoscyphus fraxineus]|uniref:Uncharacterized protein n=1 Tax=Hymenoscyphus fraxineus TaxID=746836 RepID=A0A9N9L388_9HELO|nr:hypothetical protein HYFRA_00001338 [Hymenoscyphus fraxineus]